MTTHNSGFNVSVHSFQRNGFIGGKSMDLHRDQRMGVSENDFWNGMGFLLKGKSSRRCQRSPAKASRWRGTARQQSLQSLQSLRRCRRGVESVEVQEIKNRCVCCVKCEPKGFHQLLQKKNLFFGDLKLSCSPTWHLEFRCNLTCVFACL